jgi:tripartite-type tricarboxylate transporter receptor subunit TctC
MKRRHEATIATQKRDIAAPRKGGLRMFLNSLRSRKAVVGAVLGTVFIALAGIVLAQSSYPTRPIRLVVGFAAGGPSDVLARVASAAMSKTLGNQIYVENRTGASGNLATELVARAEPDGYTLLLATISQPVNETLFKDFQYRGATNFAMIASMVETGLVLLVNPELEIKSVHDLIALAKAKPGEVLYATAGKGTATHLAAELFSEAAGVKMTPVHYRGGGETLKDLLSGQVKVMFSTLPPVLDFVRQGKLRGLATTGSLRDKSLPELPTIAEVGIPGYEVQLWSGFSAPKKTPQPIIDKLADAARKSLEDPETLKALDRQGYSAKYLGPAEFERFYAREVTKWSKVANAIGAD